MGDRLATIDIGRKLGGCGPFLAWSWVPDLDHYGRGQTRSE